MSPDRDWMPTITELVDKLYDDELSVDEQSDLNQILTQGSRQRSYYLAYTNFLVTLECKGRVAVPSVTFPSGDLAGTHMPPIPNVLEAASNRDQHAEIALPSVPPVSGFLGNAIHTSIGFLSSEWSVGYLVATVIFAIGLLVGSLVTVSHYTQIARNEKHVASRDQDSLDGSVSKADLAPSSQATEFVGRITAMVHCRWSDPQTEAINSANVPIGRTYALSAGLMEITYNSGAKIILQGPVTYKADSARGGYLSIGKLTARVEKRSGARGQGAEKSNLISQTPDPLFAVHTPTATVTDLGTEFGVEVDKQGSTLSYVYRGAVRMQTSALDANGEDQSIALHENESARAEKSVGLQSSVTLRRVSSNPKTFVRHIRPMPKFVDLLDIVAGGDGAGNRRERGIDPQSGREDPSFMSKHTYYDGKYHQTPTYRLIDGVFVVDGSKGPTQLDSAGDIFDGFPKTEGLTFGSIWARAATIRPQYRRMGVERQAWLWVYAFDPTLNEKIMPESRGFLGLHSNAGITFDLEAIRRAYDGRQLARFCATLGKDRRSLTEVWVFVDGRLKVRHMLKPAQDSWSGTIPIDVAIEPTDRFLTLTSTDGGDGINEDWVAFGNPTLQWAAEEPRKEPVR